MAKFFKLYVLCILTGWAFRAFWDLNHTYHWIPSGDFFWATGLSVMLFGCAIYIDKNTVSKSFPNKACFVIAKMFSRLFLFTSISNLCDELFFNPFVVSWEEWFLALLVLTFLYFQAIWKTIKHIFK
jgi:putative Mn2+ efflux pump MntP